MAMQTKCGLQSLHCASILTGKNFVANHGITDWKSAPEGEDWRSYKRFFKTITRKLAHALPQEFNYNSRTALKAEGYKTFPLLEMAFGRRRNKSLPTDYGLKSIKEVFMWVSPANGRYFAPFSNPYLEDLRRKKVLKTFPMKVGSWNQRPLLTQIKNQKF